MRQKRVQKRKYPVLMILDRQDANAKEIVLMLVIVFVSTKTEKNVGEFAFFLFIWTKWII